MKRADPNLRAAWHRLVDTFCDVLESDDPARSFIAVCSRGDFQATNEIVGQAQQAIIDLIAKAGAAHLSFEERSETANAIAVGAARLLEPLYPEKSQA